MTNTMGIAALLLAISMLISRFMGLIRDKVISWQFGSGTDADIYFTAFVIPDFINYLLAGGYLSITLIPFLADKFEKEKENTDPLDISLNPKDSWHFFSTVFSYAAITITSLTIFAFIFADTLTKYIAPGFSIDEQIRLAYFLRIILFAQVFFLLGACFTSILYIRKLFLIPALMPLIYNGFILVFGIAFPYLGLAQGMEGFCYGVLFGAFVGAFLLPYLAVKKDGFELFFSLKHKDFKKFLLIALPLMLGQSVVVLDEQFVRIFGSMAGDGAVSLLNYARRIMLVPVGVIAQAAAVASFPFLASLLAKKAYKEFDQTLVNAINSSLILIIPISAFMILQSDTIIAFIFEGGIFTKEDTIKAAPLLQIMLLSVPFWAIQQIIGRAFYAKQDTISPALIGSFASLIVVPLYIYFTPMYGAKIVAFFTTFSLIIYTTLLLLYWQKKNSAFITLACVKSFMRSLLLVIPPTFFAWYLDIKLMPYLENFSPIMQEILELTLTGIVFSFIWLVLFYNLCKEDYKMILAPILNKLLRKIK